MTKRVTIPITVRVDLLDLAEVARLMVKLGIPPTGINRATIIGSSLSVAANSARSQVGLPAFESAKEALDFLQATGLQFDGSRQAKRAVIRALQEVALEADFGSTDYAGVKELKNPAKEMAGLVEEVEKRMKEKENSNG